MGLARPSTAAALAAAVVCAAAATGAASAAARDPFLVVAGVIGVAFVALAFGRLADAVALFVVSTFVEQIPGAGAGLTLVKAVGAVVVLAWAVALLRRSVDLRMLDGVRGGVVAAAVALFAWALASAAWAADAHVALDTALRLGQGVLLVVVLVSVLRTPAALRAAIWAFVAGACLSAVLGLAGVGAAPTGTGTARIGGGLGDPNYLAAVLVAGIFFALGLRPGATSRAARLVLAAAPVLFVIALFRTESRGGVVALAAAIVVALVLARGLRRQVLGGAFAVLAGGAIYLGLFAPTSAHRILDVGGSGTGRTELWAIAWQVFGHHPLGGVGSGNFPVVESSYVPTTFTDLARPYYEVTLHEVVHNTYLHVLAELGIVGGVLLALLLLGALGLGRRTIAAAAREGNPANEALAAGLVTGAVGLLVAFAFLTAQYEKQLWIAIGLLVAAHAVLRTRPAETTDPAPVDPAVRALAPAGGG